MRSGHTLQLGDGEFAHATHPPVQDIRDLLAFKIARIAAIHGKAGQGWTQKEFGLRLSEWRILGIVAAMQPVAFNEIARATGMDKGQLSRIINHERMSAFLTARPCRSDNRTIELLTTQAGRELHDRMLAFALQRNQAIASHFTQQEIDDLFRLIGKLSDHLTRSAEEPT
ncbi:MAG: MarR family winged helix-turn-helix transcriptional regulator [Rhizobiaceae bacterium]